MTVHLVIKTVLVIALLLTYAVVADQTRRGRNEGTINIPASNVVGNGNITFRSLLIGNYQSTGFGGSPSLGMNVGVAHMLQLTGNVTIDNFSGLGVAEGHMQVTTPGNDRLRFFGVAVSGDLYLSTEIDTLSGVATTGRPEYNAYIRPSLITDIDWIARFNWLPLKTHCSVGLADNPDLLFRYSQLAFRLGFALKFEKNSYSVDVGAGLYKEKKNIQDGSVGDPNYAQQLVWVEPSVRYRMFNRGSVLCGVRALLFQRVKRTHPLETEYLRVAVGVEIPLVFKETNSEAIRTMLFVERHKRLRSDTLQREKRENLLDSETIKLTIEGLDLETVDVEAEAALRKRREEIQLKMDEIEQLLEGLE